MITSKLRNMKNVFFAFVVTLIFGSTQLSAQTVENFRLGVQASPTFTWLNSNDNQITGDGTILGINFGLNGEFYIAENYAIVSGLSLLTNQGGKLNYGFSGNFWPRAAADKATMPSATQIDSIPTNSTLTYKVQYIEIPIGLKLRSNEIGYIRYFAQLPTFSLAFKTNARGDIEGTGLSTERENITNDVNPLNINWGFGGGLEYSLSENVSAVGGIFYSGNLLDLTKDSNTEIFSSGLREDSKATTNAIIVRIGILF